MDPILKLTGIAYNSCKKTVLLSALSPFHEILLLSQTTYDKSRRVLLFYLLVRTSLSKNVFIDKTEGLG